MSAIREKRSQPEPRRQSQRESPERDNVIALPSAKRAPSTHAAAANDGVLDAVVDGRQITLDAENEIVLRCGKASITLTRSGKIILRGTHVVSRSSGANRVQGSQVRIN